MVVTLTSGTMRAARGYFFCTRNHSFLGTFRIFSISLCALPLVPFYSFVTTICSYPSPIVCRQSFYPQVTSFLVAAQAQRDATVGTEGAGLAGVEGAPRMELRDTTLVRGLFVPMDAPSKFSISQISKRIDRSGLPFSCF